MTKRNRNLDTQKRIQVPGPRCLCQSHQEVCDFVIVGAGTGSLTLAGLLADIPDWRVCILERGPLETNMSGWFTNSYKFTSPHDPVWLTNPALQTIVDNKNKNKDGRNIYIPRFRGRGGTSRVYGAIVRRASPSVLNLWPDGWKHEELTYYYKKLEDHYCYYDSEASTGISKEDCEKWHGKGGAMQVNTQVKEAFQKFSREMEYICNETSRPWNGYAVDYNGPLEDRKSCSVFQQFKLRTEARDNRASKTARGSSFTGYYHTRKNKPELYTSMTATKILFKNGVTIGVLALDEDGGNVVKFLARKEVILGGGSFDTPHLLQVSGIGPKDLLQKIKVDIVADNPHVGQHLWDHISVPYVLKLSPDSNELCCTNETTAIPYIDIDGKTYMTKELDSINRRFSWIIHHRSNVTREPNDMTDVQLYVMGNSKLFDTTGSLCTSDETTDYDPNDYNEGTIRIIDQWPEYRGTINAVTSNIFDKPSLDYGWTYTVDGKPTKEFQQVATLVRDEIRLLRDIFFGNDVSENMKKLIIDEVAPGKELDTDDELDSWMRGMFVSALHPVGTCKMPECANEFLQVRGVLNLRICDASAFATQTDGNPSATLFAMGEKLADMLKFQYLKYIKVVIRRDMFATVNKRKDNKHNFDISEIKSKTKCFDVKVKKEWITTGRDSSAIIYKWSITCNGDKNEKKVADLVSRVTLKSDYQCNCSSADIPSFAKQKHFGQNEKSTPMHYESSYIFVVWCQTFRSVNSDELWKKVGNWKGPTTPGSINCFKLNYQNEICMTLENYDSDNRELAYNEDFDSLSVTNYIAVKKVAELPGSKSSTYFRTWSMKSKPGADWNYIAGYLSEHVYAISGQGIRSSEKVVRFDLDNTLLETEQLRDEL